MSNLCPNDATYARKSEELDGNILEGMYFCLKNMPQLQNKPESLTHKVFDKIFEVSEFLEMDEETRAKILDNMTTERDLRNQLAYARKEGRAEVADKMLKAGMDIQQIAELTQLSVEEVEALKA